MNNISIVSESTKAVEEAIIAGLSERLGCKNGVVSEGETAIKKLLFARLEELRQDLLLLELEDNLLASNQKDASERKRCQIEALKDVEGKIKAEEDERKQKAMRGAKGRVLAQIDEIKTELDKIFKDRGEVLGNIKVIRAERAALKKQLNTATATSCSSVLIAA